MIARRLPIVLPAIHIALVILTLLTDQKAASGGNPFFCVDLPISLPLVARGDTPTIVIVAVLATAWWYFVGQIGWASRQHKIGRVGSLAAAALAVLICAFDFILMSDEFSRISRDPRFSAADGVIYLLAVALLFGGATSGAMGATSALQA